MLHETISKGLPLQAEYRLPSTHTGKGEAGYPNHQTRGSTGNHEVLGLKINFEIIQLPPNLQQKRRSKRKFIPSVPIGLAVNSRIELSQILH